MKQRHPTTVGYRVWDGMLLTSADGRIVRVFMPQWWALHRWVAWGLGFFTRSSGRVDVQLRRGSAIVIESVRVIEVMKRKASSSD